MEGFTAEGGQLSVAPLEFHSPAAVVVWSVVGGWVSA